ncbi:pyrimidine/purine nucleoside phosphorylase [Candidatus Bipolaricaulota bacterium]|nr:pyrimidine/purine nucleoside phosphorylase [Candidatus Bipolaricaulota bacterium]
MLKVNEYFDGKVKSIAFKDSEGPITSGVMEAGDYTFSTGSKELMIVVTGSLTIKRPEDDEWVTFFEGESFNVPAGVSFEVKVEGPTAYICRYS